MASKLSQLQAYWDGTADEDTKRAVEADLGDSNSLLSRGLKDAVGSSKSISLGIEVSFPSEDPSQQPTESLSDKSDTVPSAAPPASRFPNATESLSENSGTTPSSGRFRWMSIRTAAISATAALVVVGLALGLAGFRLHKNVEYAARVTLRENPVRGPGFVSEIAVENLSGRRAYVTLVGLAPGRNPALHYRENNRFIDVEPNSIRPITNLPTQFDGCTAFFVVLTATPAGETVRGLLSEPIQAEKIEESKQNLMKALLDGGYSGVAVEIAFPPK